MSRVELKYLEDTPLEDSQSVRAAITNAGFKRVD